MQISPMMAALSQAGMLVIVIGGLALLYLCLKATTFIAKLFFLFITLLILAGAGWYFFAGHAR